MLAAANEASTLLLSRAVITRLARATDYIEAVEGAFRALAAAQLESLPVGHVPGRDGAFHIKAALSCGRESRVAIKINGNFPGNPEAHRLPTIQGCLLLSDAANGRLLAIMDSIEITAQRTAAASAVAARYLARRSASTLAMIGCGLQADYHLQALLALRQFALREVRCFDVDPHTAAAFVLRVQRAGLLARVADSVADACREADIVVSCTPARSPIIHASDIAAGCFIAAVGADNPTKNEIAPALMAKARVVADIRSQALEMGDTRAAIAAGCMQENDIHAELAQVVAGERPGRNDDEQIIVFDSTGTAIEDLAAANMLYARAAADPAALRIALNAAPD